jgi:hypothetical protein
LVTYLWMVSAPSVNHHVLPVQVRLRTVTLVMDQVVPNLFINEDVGQIALLDQVQIQMN